ncbi:hypothetical protein CGCA056_v014605 [Colletotrichum aenigma]|uniref:uncharacterized protein n=1 Tax=Colletotrichum aenigma TaxID=1215731 RepID=UPI001872C3B5|nr:uncharacterized protein CGCA056_v014605 [Colletotrichum aenigma]KAF5501826.1 hypothetical protein CGCA056_v014605 [Colletotrichum aenigma]
MSSWGHIPSLLERVRLIVHESKTALGRKAYSKIMDKLNVDGMVDRFDEVDEAHEHTFGWILEPGPAPETETAEDTQAHQGIIDWLCHGDGVFHITGKPGAGKSTLMKYLCQSPMDQEFLSSWAGDKLLMTTNFFFWRLGIDVQKSLHGLRRALLYAILQELPGLTENVFPRHWKSVLDDKLVSIHTKDVNMALQALFEQTDFLLSHRLVFFIDGLDEYHGDHDGMLKTLLKWTKEHKSDIKLCVSSREWEIFTQRLADCPRIKLQEITRRDMQTYVNEELYENEEFTQVSLRSPEILDLAHIITQKAEGVFLEESIPWPSLFQVPLVYYSFIDEYERDKDFAINLPLGKMENSTQRERIEKARRMIYQRCMGLLETYTVPSDDEPEYYKPRIPKEQGVMASIHFSSQRTTTLPTSEAGGYIEDEAGLTRDAESSSSSSYWGSRSFVSGESKDEYFHKHVRFDEDGKFNHRFIA